MSRRSVRAVLFDLDGTLLDTARDMAEALNRLREAEGLERLPFGHIRPLVSHGAARLIRHAFGDPDAERYESLRRRFLDLYAGVGLFGAGSLGNGRLSDTVRAFCTSPKALRRFSSVIRLSAPSWSSGPQRPQFLLASR